MSDFKPTSLRRSAKRHTSKPAADLVLGYTRTGRSVLLPTEAAPDTSDSAGYRHTAELFADWTWGDHVDASRILKEHGEREQDRKIATWCKHWGRAHKDLGGR